MAKKEKEVKTIKTKKSKKEEKNKRHFLKDFKAELKRVVWPTPKQLVNSTVAVITIVLAVGIIVFALDMGFKFLNGQNAKIQAGLQEKYSNSIESNTISEESDEASSEDTNVIEVTTEDAE